MNSTACLYSASCSIGCVDPRCACSVTSPRSSRMRIPRSSACPAMAGTGSGTCVSSRETFTNGRSANLNGVSYTARTTEGLSGRRTRKYCRVDASPVSGTTRTPGPEIPARSRHSSIRALVSRMAGERLSMRQIRHNQIALSLNDRAILEAGSSRNLHPVGQDAAGQVDTLAHLHVIPNHCVDHTRRLVYVGSCPDLPIALRFRNRQGGPQVLAGRADIPELSRGQERANASCMLCDQPGVQATS